MNDKLRKRIWPVSLTAAIGVVAMLAVLAATMWQASPAQAQQPPPAEAPGNLRLTVVSDTQIDLAWFSALGASSYEVQRKTGSGEFATVSPGPTGSATTFSDMSLMASTMYTYRVRGVNASGEGAWSAEMSDTTMAATSVPAVPGFSIAHGGQAGQLVVSWDTVTGAHEYVVQHRRCSATPCSGDFEAVTRPATARSYTITGLSSGASYQVRLTANDTAGMAVAQSTSALVNTSRYLLTFKEGTTPSRSDSQDIRADATAGQKSTITATVWVPATETSNRTDTLTVQFTSMDDTATPLKYHGVDVDDRDEFRTLGLLAVAEADIGHGELTIRPRDDDKRSFNMEFACTLPATRVNVIIYDDQADVVERGSVTLECPAPPLPTGETAGPECYSVTGSVDQMRDDLDLLATNKARTVNSSVAGTQGIKTDAKTGKQEITNRRAEVGQDTTEVLVSSGSVQLTVTSCEPGPVYIRFVDSDMNVFGTDVDECTTCSGAAGADVVGLDSQGKLEMNVGPKAMDSTMALMYDQYSLRETAMSRTRWVQYLEGNPGEAYYQGNFRFMDPCSAVGDHFYVEVYEKVEKNIRKLENGMTREKVTCVPSLQATAKDLTITFTTADKSATTRGAVMTWEPIMNAATYTAAVIDPSGPNGRPAIHGGVSGIKMVSKDVTRRVEFDDLVIGKRYIFALYATLTDGTYSVLKFDRLTP